MARRFREVREISETEKLRELQKTEEQRMQERHREVREAAQRLDNIGREERRILEMEKQYLKDRELLLEQKRKNSDLLKIKEQENALSDTKREIDGLKRELRATYSRGLAIDDPLVYAIATGYDINNGYKLPPFKEELQKEIDFVFNATIAEDRDYDEPESVLELDNDPDWMPSTILDDQNDMELELDDIATNAASGQEQQLKDLERNIQEDKKRLDMASEHLARAEQILDQEAKRTLEQWQQGISPTKESIDERNKMYEQVQRMRMQVAEMSQGITEKEIQAQELREVIATQSAISMSSNHQIKDDLNQEIDVDELGFDEMEIDLDSLIEDRDAQEIDLNELIPDDRDINDDRFMSQGFDDVELTFGESQESSFDQAIEFERE